MEVLSALSLAPSILRAFAMNGAFQTMAKVGYLLPDANPARHNLSVEKDIRYRGGKGTAHLLDVYVPSRAPRNGLPVVMYVHGGGFCMLSKDTHRVMAMAIARQGYLVFNINYRLGPRHTFPAPLEDACDALLWVHKNAARFGGDASRIAIAGESAGGNLVTALAVAHAYRRPEPFARRLFDANLPLRAVIATYGFLDIGYIDEYLAHPKYPRWIKALLLDAAKMYLGPNVRAEVAKKPLASPLRVIADHGEPDRALPPFFLSVGTRDPLIRCSKRLKTLLDEKGHLCELHVSPGEIHGYDALIWRRRAQEKWHAAHAFLARHMLESHARAAE